MITITIIIIIMYKDRDSILKLRSSRKLVPKEVVGPEPFV